MLPSSSLALIVTLSPLILFSWIVSGHPLTDSASLRSDLNRLELALNAQKLLIEEQAQEIVTLKEFMSGKRKNELHQNKEINQEKEEIEKIKLRLDLWAPVISAVKLRVFGVNFDFSEFAANKDLDKTGNKLPTPEEDSKQKQDKLLKLFTGDKRNNNETIKMGGLIHRIGLDWMDQKVIAKHGSKVLLDLSEFYEKANLPVIMQQLVNNGVNPKNSSGFQVLGSLTTKYKHDNLEDLVKFLIQNGLEVDNNVLIYLCRNYEGSDLLNIIKLLVSIGIDVNHKGEDGRNSLDLLSMNYSIKNHLEIYQYLISVGINVNNVNDWGDSVLTRLVTVYSRADLIDMIKLLVSSGANVNHGGKYNAIYGLCQTYRGANRDEIIEFLISSGSRKQKC